MQQINIVISGFTPYDGIDVNPAVLVPVALADIGMIHLNPWRCPTIFCRMFP